MKNEVQTVDELWERIMATANNLRQREHQEGGSFGLLRQTWIRRGHVCLQVDRQNFEQLL